MKLGHIISEALGFVAGILIPGASASVANKTQTVQQHLADLFGLALTDLSKQLAVDTTGLSGMQKVFVLSTAMVGVAKAQGFKGDLAILEATALDVAQAAYRATLANPEEDVNALAVAIGAATGMTGVTTFAADIVDAAIATVRGAPAAAPVAASAAAAPAPQPG